MNCLDSSTKGREKCKLRSHCDRWFLSVFCTMGRTPASGPLGAALDHMEILDRFSPHSTSLSQSVSQSVRRQVTDSGREALPSLCNEHALKVSAQNLELHRDQFSQTALCLCLCFLVPSIHVGSHTSVKVEKKL